MNHKTRFNRRRFLRGAGGVAIGLPLLETFDTRPAWSAVAGQPVYGVFVVTMNGVQQAGFGSEPDRFWPRGTPTTAGLPLTRASLMADNDVATSGADRAIGELADHADRLLVVKGIKYAGTASGCSHSTGSNKCLTAHNPSTDPTGGRSLAMGESVDNRIGREFMREPLALYVGAKAGMSDNLSYRAAKNPRVGENNPWLAYTKMVGMNPVNDPLAAQKLATKRMSVNDLVREEMKELLGRPDLSTNDRQRLQLHFDTVRDIEVKITTTLPPEQITALMSVNTTFRNNDQRLKIERLHMDLVCFAFASGYTPVAYIQVGDGIDQMRYTMPDGTIAPSFHLVSHRASSNGAVSDGTMPDAVNQHHKIDRIRLGQFKYLLDRMAATTTPDGNLLDIGFATWTNQVGTGNHATSNLPWIIAGGARNFFKKGFVATPNTVNNKLLNVFINAFGIRKTDNSLVDDFGEPTLSKGVIPQLMG